MGTRGVSGGRVMEMRKKTTSAVSLLRFSERLLHT